MKTAQQLFDEHFTNNTTRDPRSAAYKRGALELWDRKLHGVKREAPFKAGSAEFDAYFAGAEEAANTLARINEKCDIDGCGNDHDQDTTMCASCRDGSLRENGAHFAKFDKA